MYKKQEAEKGGREAWRGRRSEGGIMEEGREVGREEGGEEGHQEPWD